TGGLRSDMSPGDLVVANQVRSARACVPLPAVALLVAALRRAGHTVHTGPVVESDHLVDGADRDRLAESGAIAVDMESARLLESLGSRGACVVRAVSDTPRQSVRSPAVLRNGRDALSALSGLGPILREWARVRADRNVLLAMPRAVCAGD